MYWDTSNLADALGSIFNDAEQALRQEQAVYGLDTLDEMKLHEVAARGLATSYDVAREVHYPSSAGKKLTHRQRCDLVVTAKGRPLKLDSKPPDLFDPPDQASPEDGFWLEIKSAYQFREGGRAHGGYGNQWRGGIVEDLRKMEAEPLIRHAGLLLIVFTESLEIVEKDLELFEDHLVRKELLAGFRQVRHTPILERMGHRLCTCALWPTVQRE